MATINSVLGPLDTSELGFTLTHEHVFTASAGILQTFPELFGNCEQFTEQAASTLREAREGGVQTIIDLTTLDLGRDVRFLAEMARRTGVNIIAATRIWARCPTRAVESQPGRNRGVVRTRDRGRRRGTGARVSTHSFAPGRV